MGQKTNPIILRLGGTKNSYYRYLEKKPSELALYDFNNIEIKKFVCKFFRDNGLNISKCKINYSQEGAIQIFVSYYAIPEFENLIDNSSEVLKLKKIRDQNKKNSTYRLLNVFKSFKNRAIKKRVFLKKKIRKSYLNPSKNNNALLFKKYTNLQETQSNYLINLFSDSLTKFLNKKINIFVTFQQLNRNFKKKIDKKKVEGLKRRLIKLYRYKRNKFFEEGVNTLFTCSHQSNSSNLLADFLAKQLKSLKRHNFFLRFVKDCLKIFFNSGCSKLAGIKIKIKGRLNRRPRARHRFLKIGKELPLLSINSKIDYSEKTAFTPNGTMGVKVWTFIKKKRNVKRAKTNKV